MFYICQNLFIMSKTTTKQFFVKKLYEGFIITEEGKEIAIATTGDLKQKITRQMNFINSVIDLPTTQNFGLTITLEENVNQKMEDYMDKKWCEIKNLKS